MEPSTWAAFLAAVSRWHARESCRRKDSELCERRRRLARHGRGRGRLEAELEGNLNNDFEYQHKVERSVCGYQLLGGDNVPDLVASIPSTMLGYQSWEKPNTFDTFNAGTRLDYDLPHVWRAFAQAVYSHSLIDDNVVYAYGCYYEADCNTGSAPDPWFFAPDGTYDIYDYRNPGELRIDAEGEAMVTGHVQDRHDQAGPCRRRRTLFAQCAAARLHTVAEPYSSDGVVQDGAVYTYVGSENIYQPIAPVDLAPSKVRTSPLARAAFGKTVTRPQPSCRIAFICPAACN